jgi:hypothetical protein
MSVNSAESEASMFCSSRHAFTLAALLLASVLTVGTARATLMQVGSRNDLGANLEVNWSIFGPAGTALQCFCSAQAGGLTVSVNSSSGTVDRFNEGVPPYKGNFAIGDALVSQPFSSDEMTVGFTTNPVFAVGTQIQPLNYTGPFTGVISVLTNDGMDAEFSVSGNSTTAEDNSAPFLGVVSTTDDIIGFRVFAEISSAFSGDVAINQLDVRAAPEPGSALLLATSALLLIAGTSLRGRRTGLRG